MYIQLFKRRSKYVKPGKETTAWEQLSYHFMTEESGGSDDEITRHKLPWRSESKNFVPYTYMHVGSFSLNWYICIIEASKFIARLDKRYRNDCNQKGTNLVQKNRVEGSASKLPRMEGPDWAIQVLVSEPASNQEQQEEQPSIAEEPVPQTDLGLSSNQSGSDSEYCSDSDCTNPK